jgi:spore coat protein U-like protein
MWTAENNNHSSCKEAKKRPKTRKREQKVIGEFLLAMIGLLFTMSGVVFAETAATNVTVRVNVQGTCKFSSNPKNMDFGSYDPTSAVDNIAGHTVFRYKCARGTTYRCT